MLAVAVKGVDKVLRQIEKDKKQIRFAAAVALTRTAVESKQDVSANIADTFDKPKPFTVKGVYSKPATKKDLTARVGVKPMTARYLHHHIQGTDRLTKGVEGILRGYGMLRGGEYIVPGKTLKLNAYGNVTKATFEKILRGLSVRNGPFFYARIHGVGAIWKRVGRKKRFIQPALVFIRKPDYDRTFKFYDQAEKFFYKRLPIEFDKALAEARATAR